MALIYRSSFYREQQKAQRERRELHAALWKERQDFSELLSASIPRYREFHHALETRGDIQRAVETGVLGSLKEQGYARTNSEHLTPHKLREGCRAWSIEWLGYGGLTVDRTSSDRPQTADLWHRVELVVRAEREARRIDTEFFSLNERAGSKANEFDDREKLHVVWDVPRSQAECLHLAYLGFGTNEPYDLDHLDRTGSALSGRPRFYIFDRDRRVRLEYQVRWQRGNRFDWKWNRRVLVRGSDATTVSFVEFPDESLICLSDEEMVNAASGLTQDKVLELAWSALELPGSPSEFEELGSELQRRLLDSIRVVTAEVRGPVVSKLSGDCQTPSLAEVLDAAGKNYLPYFVATSAARARERGSDQLLAAVRQLEPSRAKEYEQILNRDCSEVFASKWCKFLPRKMAQLFRVTPEILPKVLRSAVQEWIEDIGVQIDRDLYHYGQNPADRVHRLRLGAWLALSPKHGDVYRRVLDTARDYVDSGTAHGSFDVALF